MQNISFISCPLSNEESQSMYACVTLRDILLFSNLNRLTSVCFLLAAMGTFKAALKSYKEADRKLCTEDLLAAQYSSATFWKSIKVAQVLHKRQMLHIKSLYSLMQRESGHLPQRQ